MAGKMLKDMTPAEQQAAIKRAAATFQKELERTSDKIAEVLDSVDTQKDGK